MKRVGNERRRFSRHCSNLVARKAEPFAQNFQVVLAETRRRVANPPRSAAHDKWCAWHPHLARHRMLAIDEVAAGCVLLVMRDFGGGVHRERGDRKSTR